MSGAHPPSTSGLTGARLGGPSADLIAPVALVSGLALSTALAQRVAELVFDGGGRPADRTLRAARRQLASARALTVLGALSALVLPAVTRGTSRE